MRKLTISNRTEDFISIDCHASTPCVILPSATIAIEVPRYRPSLILSTISGEKGTAYGDKKVSVNAATFSIQLPLAFGAQWKVVKAEENCPWRIYRSKVSLCDCYASEFAV